MKSVRKSGVKTTWGARNLAFCNARKAMRAGKRAEAEAFIAQMAAVQPLSKREQAAIDRAAS